jgi:HD superfamily phosphohydrolase
MATRPIQRLRGIYNNACVYSINPWKDFTRYEHSLGVMLFLRLKGASLEEQIAGLLHDIPHTVFSHAVDFLFNDESFEFHEKFHEKLVTESLIPTVLERHGYDLKRILDENNFSLLENKIPNICADRIDYTLREFVAKEGKNPKIKEYIDNITIHKKSFVFTDKEIAKEFSERFLEMIQRWGSAEELATQQIIVSLLKMGLDKKIIDYDDLFTTDLKVFNKLKAAHDKEIDEKFKLLNPNLKVKNDPEDYDYYAKEKNRYIDPFVLNENKRVSEIYPEFYNLLKDHKEYIKKGIYAKIIKV